MIYNSVFSGIVYIILLAICIGECKPKPSNEKIVLLKRFNNLRGLFALEIIVGHVIRYDKTILYPLGKFMIISVAFFFFVSAFGLSYSFRVKDNYLKGFIKNKCGYLLCLIAVVYIFNVLISLVVPVHTGYYEGIYSIIPLLIKSTNWYLWELFAFYLVFYIIFRFLKSYRWLYVFVLLVFLNAYLFKTGWEEAWYASSFAFPFGLFYEENYEKCNKFLCSKKGKAFTVLFVCLGLSSQFLGQDSLIGMVYLRNTMCIAGLLILIYVLQYFEINNQVLRVLTKYSTELYLFQFIFLRISEAYQWDYKARMIFVVGLTGITALIMHLFIEKIRSYLKRTC